LTAGANQSFDVSQGPAPLILFHKQMYQHTTTGQQMLNKMLVAGMYRPGYFCTCSHYIGGRPADNHIEKQLKSLYACTSLDVSEELLAFGRRAGLRTINSANKVTDVSIYLHTYCSYKAHLIAIESSINGQIFIRHGRVVML
jgi:hypothetical protein